MSAHEITEVRRDIKWLDILDSRSASILSLVAYCVYTRSMQQSWFTTRPSPDTESKHLTYSAKPLHCVSTLSKWDRGSYLPEVDLMRQVTAPLPAFWALTVMQYSSPLSRVFCIPSVILHSSACKQITHQNIKIHVNCRWKSNKNLHYKVVIWIRSSQGYFKPTENIQYFSFFLYYKQKFRFPNIISLYPKWWSKFKFLRYFGIFPYWWL